MSERKIKATLVFEMMGRPKEHVASTMEKLIEVINNEKGIKVSNKRLHEIKQVENKDKDGKPIPATPGSELFTTFSEVDVEVDKIINLISLCFRFMPSHVEVVEPDSFVLNNFELNSILNEIVLKLHNYDAIAKAALMQNQILVNKLQIMAGKKLNQEPTTQQAKEQSIQPQNNIEKSNISDSKEKNKEKKTKKKKEEK